MSEMQIGKFQVVGPLGSGAHSKILHVRRSADGKNYALKVVPIDGPDDQKYLEQAEGKVEILLKKAGAEMVAEPFDPEAGEDS